MAPPEGPLLSVIVAAYNEAETIGPVLERVLAEPTPKEVVVVDDASTDETPERLAAIRDARLRVIRHDRNRGKGAAIRTGIAAATGRFAIFQDADLEVFPEEYPALLEPILSGRADAVMGVRVLADGADWPLRFRAANRIFSLAASAVAGRRISDVMVCYKVAAVPHLRAIGPTSARFDVEPEIALGLHRMGLRVAEVPIRYAPRTRAQGKKIRWTDSIRVLRAIVRFGLLSDPPPRP